MSTETITETIWKPKTTNWPPQVLFGSTNPTVNGIETFKSAGPKADVYRYFLSKAPVDVGSVIVRETLRDVTRQEITETSERDAGILEVSHENGIYALWFAQPCHFASVITISYKYSTPFSLERLGESWVYKFNEMVKRKAQGAVQSRQEHEMLERFALKAEYFSRCHSRVAFDPDNKARIERLKKILLEG